MEAWPAEKVLRPFSQETQVTLLPLLFLPSRISLGLHFFSCIMGTTVM